MHLFVELNKPGDDVTAYRVIEDYIKHAIIRSRHPSVSDRPIETAIRELQITDGSIRNTRTNEVYQLPPELDDALKIVKIASDLNAFVFRGVSENQG